MARCLVPEVEYMRMPVTVVVASQPHSSIEVRGRRWRQKNFCKKSPPQAPIEIQKEKPATSAELIGFEEDDERSKLAASAVVFALISMSNLMIW